MVSTVGILAASCKIEDNRVSRGRSVPRATLVIQATSS